MQMRRYLKIVPYWYYMENLLLCSRTLYDKDLLDKTKEIEKLRKENEELKKSPIAELNIVFYGHMRCPYCRKSKEVFERNSCLNDIEFVDTSYLKGYKQFVSAGGPGIPYFKSWTTGKTFTGYPGTVAHLRNVLSGVKMIELEKARKEMIMLLCLGICMGGVRGFLPVFLSFILIWYQKNT